MFRTNTYMKLLAAMWILSPDLRAQESMATIGRDSSNQEAGNIQDATLDDSFGANKPNSDVDPGAASAGTNSGWDGFGAPIDDFAGANEETNLGFENDQVENVPVEAPPAAAAQVIPVQPSSAPQLPLTPRAPAAPQQMQAPVVIPQPSARVAPVAAEPEAAPMMPQPAANIPAPQTATAMEDFQVPAAPTLPPPNEFAGAPPIPGTRRIMADGEAPAEYIVEHGDTLFDVCDQLIDEPDYWPKLWALNPEIKNPHFIYPGMRLRFYPGDASTPPYLQVIAEEDLVPVDKGALVEAQLIAESFPARAAEAVEILQASNDFVVVDADSIEVTQDILDGFIVEGSNLQSSRRRLVIPAFFFEEERESLAVVVAGKDGERVSGDSSDAIVELESSLATGTTYTVLRPSGPVDNPDTGDFVGYRYEVVGTVRVIRTLGDDHAAVRVSETRIGVRPGDIVVPYISTIRSFDSAELGSPSEYDAAVVGFESRGMSIAGQGDVVYLDRTAASGLSAGSWIRLFRKTGITRIKEYSGFEGSVREPVAVVRILDVSGPVAIGWVITGSTEIRLGDRAKSG